MAYEYIEKVIKFNINTSDVNANGESKEFIINGDEGAFFSFEIYDNSGC